MSDEVFAEYDWKRMVLYLYELANDDLQEYMRLNFNQHKALKTYDSFLSKLARLFTDIRPKLEKQREKGEKEVVEGSQMSVDDVIEIMDVMRNTQQRLKPEVAIQIFDVLTVFLEKWGLTKVERMKRDPSKAALH